MALMCSVTHYFGRDLKNSFTASKIRLAFVSNMRLYFYLVAYLSSYHEKAINALYELALELPAICLPHQNAGILVSGFPNGTSKLAGLFFALSL